MSDPGPKDDLLRYLQIAREALLWKLEGLSEYDVRRPLTPTGTNLLGLVKHLAYVEMGYFGATFGRPVPEAQPWVDDEVEANADMWATARESREEILALYRRAWAVADETLEALPLEAVGDVPWWAPDRRTATLHRILVHVLAETQRHVGHADIVRELVDGAAGLRADNDNLPPVDQAWWEAYRAQVERAAREAAVG
jgi:uncharacterized damage-inducible protein DinB